MGAQFCFHHVLGYVRTKPHLRGNERSLGVPSQWIDVRWSQVHVPVWRRQSLPRQKGYRRSSRQQKQHYHPDRGLRRELATPSSRAIGRKIDRSLGKLGQLRKSRIFPPQLDLIAFQKGPKKPSDDLYSPNCAKLFAHDTTLLYR